MERGHSGNLSRGNRWDNGLEGRQAGQGNLAFPRVSEAGGGPKGLPMASPSTQGLSLFPRLAEPTQESNSLHIHP